MNLNCSNCKELLPVESFSKKPSSKRGYQYKCKNCHNAYVRDTWYINNRKKQQDSNYKWKKENKSKVFASKYNCSVELIEELWSRGKCDICGSNDKLGIDHCHNSGMVRGILCAGCNHALGKFKDNVDAMKIAIEYLERADLQVKNFPS